ncbi:fosfomycin resistance glutathione transferase [Hahella sp. NBU794]|uniref:fosfomycin resistance glutathione transferase n=1 Tax=Hahella sp. NBU794 TaxID=3422590 RepID=UPI003D6E2E14
MLNGLNHITIAVSDLDVAFEFYVSLLGMTPHAKWKQGAYLSAGELWLCLSLDASRPSGDYSHIAFDIAEKDFPLMRETLNQAGVKQWKQNRSEGDSLYVLDPDGHKLEIHVGSLQSRLRSLREEPYEGLQLFD